MVDCEMILSTISFFQSLILVHHLIIMKEEEGEGNEK